MVKRYLTIHTIKSSLEKKNTLQELFKPDVMIFLDDYSSKVYQLFKKGNNEKQILQQIRNWNI